MPICGTDSSPTGKPHDQNGGAALSILRRSNPVAKAGPDKAGSKYQSFLNRMLGATVCDLGPMDADQRAVAVPGGCGQDLGPEGRAEADVSGRVEGILLEHSYPGKSFAGILDLAGREQISVNEPDLGHSHWRKCVIVRAN